MIRRYPHRPGCFTFTWSWTIACVLALGGCTLRGDGIPTPAWRDAGTGGDATGGADVLPAEFDPSAIAAEVRGAMPPPLDPDSPGAAAPVAPLDLTGAYIFPAQPQELLHELWGAASFSISQAIQPSTRARNIAQYGTDTVGPGTVRRGPGGVLEVLGFGAAEWIPYDRSAHLGAVRMQARYGPPWWGVGHMDPHDQAQGAYEALSRKDPVAWPPRISIGDGPPRFAGDEPLTDVSFDGGLFRRVLAAVGRPSGTTSTGGIFEVAPERLEMTATTAAAGSAVVSLDVTTGRRWRPVVERSGLPIPPGIVPPPLVTVVVAPDQLHPAGKVLLAVTVAWPAGLPPGVYDRSAVVLSAGGGTENKRRVPLILTVVEAAPPPPPPPPPVPDPGPTPGPAPPCHRVRIHCPEVEVEPGSDDALLPCRVSVLPCEGAR